MKISSIKGFEKFAPKIDRNISEDFTNGQLSMGARLSNLEIGVDEEAVENILHESHFHIVNRKLAEAIAANADKFLYFKENKT